MIIAIITKLLAWLGGGVLDRVLLHMEKSADTQTEREKLKTQVTIDQIRAAQDEIKTRSDVYKSELQYPELRLFRALAYGGAVFVFFTMIVRWLYFPGTPLAQLDPWTTSVLAVIFSGLIYKQK